MIRKILICNFYVKCKYHARVGMVEDGGHKGHSIEGGITYPGSSGVRMY